MTTFNAQGLRAHGLLVALFFVFTSAAMAVGCGSTKNPVPDGGGAGTTGTAGTGGAGTTGAAGTGAAGTTGSAGTTGASGTSGGGGGGCSVSASTSGGLGALFGLALVVAGVARRRRSR